MSGDQHLGRFVRHSGIYAIGNALNRFGAFLLLPLYTRHLTTAEYGTLELFYSISSVISGILAVGIAHATLRFYFEYPDQRDRDALVSTNLLASAAISGAGALLVAAFQGHIVQWVLGDGAPPLALPIILATMVLELSSQVCLAYLRARELSVFFVVVSLGKLVLQCTANTVLLLKFDAGVEGVLGGNMLAVGFGWLILTGFTVRHCGLHFHRDKLFPVLRYSLPFLYTTLTAVVASNIDRFMVSRLLSLEALGLYALATKFSKLISDLIGEPFNRSYGAFRFTMLGRPDAAEVQARIVRYVAAALALVGLGIAYFTGDVLHLMSDPQFWPAAGLMPLLILTAILQLLTYPAQTGILYHKSTGQLFRIMLVQTVIGTATGFLLIWQFGLQGLCVSLLLTATLGLVLTHRASQRHFPVTYDMRAMGILGVLTTGFYLPALALAAAPWEAALAVKILLYCLFVWVVFRSPALLPAERAWIREAAARLLPAMRRLPRTEG